MKAYIQIMVRAVQVFLTQYPVRPVLLYLKNSIRKQVVMGLEEDAAQRHGFFQMNILRKPRLRIFLYLEGNRLMGKDRNSHNTHILGILSHHGKLEFGSPKEPELAEAIALSFADNADAKLETFKEAVDSKVGSGDEYRWLGFNKYLESNIRKTTPENYGEE